MYWTLQFASVCEPKNPGGAIGGVCQIGNGRMKPEIVNVHKPAEPTNSNFVGNYYTLLKGLERFAEMVAEDKSPELLIYTNEKILMEQMLGKYKIQPGVYQEYADACLDILSGVFGIGQKGYGFVQVGKEDVQKAKSVASKNSRLGIVPIAVEKPVEVKSNTPTTGKNVNVTFSFIPDMWEDVVRLHIGYRRAATANGENLSDIRALVQHYITEKETSIYGYFDSFRIQSDADFDAGLAETIQRVAKAYPNQRTIFYRTNNEKCWDWEFQSTKDVLKSL